MAELTYPLAEAGGGAADRCERPPGRRDSLSARCIAGRVSADDVRISPETLLLQAIVRRATAGTRSSPTTSRRGAELCSF